MLAFERFGPVDEQMCRYVSRPNEESWHYVQRGEPLKECERIVCALHRFLLYVHLVMMSHMGSNSD